MDGSQEGDLTVKRLLQELCDGREALIRAWDLGQGQRDDC
jgi:hypothetical protein